MNQRMRNTGLAAAIAAGVVVSAPAGSMAADMTYAPTAAAASTSVFGGVNAKEDVWYAYLGGVHALNGDLDTDGWLIRAMIGGGEVDYQAGGAVGNVDSDIFDADLMVGYHIFEGRNRYTGYIGANYRDNDLSPNDPGNSTSGDEFGAKIQLEANSWMGDMWNLDAIGSYSTAYDTYWARARFGYAWSGNLLIGPEGVVSGDDEYDEQRIGVFVSGMQLGAIDVSASVGYADTSRGGDDSIYGGIEFSTRF